MSDTAKATKERVEEFIGRLESEINQSAVTVCADCAHSSPSQRRKHWVCLKRPINRDIVDGEWRFRRCDVANNGDCELFEPKPAPEQAKPLQAPQCMWSFFRRKVSA